jgi:hypothetical protein
MRRSRPEGSPPGSSTEAEPPSPRRGGSRSVPPLLRSRGRVGRGSCRRSMLTSCLDHGDDPVHIGQNFIVPEAQHQPAIFREEPVTPFMLARLRMLPAIGLHGHPQRGAREVQHERRHRMLTSENASLWCYPAIGTKDAAPHRWDTFERHGRILSPATRTAPPPCPPPRHARERKVVRVPWLPIA